MPIFMKLGDIKGASGDARFPGWIPLESIQLASPNPGASRARRQPEQTTFQSDLNITYRNGPASPDIQAVAITGKIFPLVTIVHYGGGDDDVSNDAGFTLKLKDVLISNYHHFGGSVPIESITLNYDNMTHSPRAQLPDTPAGPPVTLKRPAGRRR